MAEDDTETAGEIDGLRRALSLLEARLETFEQWRALRQLDEREKNGQPLEGIDGVLFRGRLVQSLAQSSRDWRAYVRIEEAIGHLRGPMRIEQGILKETAGFSVQSQAMGVVKPTLPGTAASQQPAPAPSALQSGKTAEPDAASGNATAASADPQRLRVKIRAGSLQVPLPPATSIHAILGPPSAPPRLAPPAGPTALPPVAALRPRPLLRRDEAEGLTAARPGTDLPDSRSPRSVLQRIRVVSKTATPSIRPEIGANPSGIDIPDATAPPLTESVPLQVSAGAALVQPMKEARTLPGEPAAVVPPAPGNPAAQARDASAGAEPEQRRLDALEAQLERLIDKSASWPHPLDAARGASHTATPRALEPDTGGELDVDEAEVTIVRLAEPEAVFQVLPETREDRASHRSPRVQAEAAELANSEISGDTDRDLDKDDYTGHRLDLEEASVEIIVSHPAASDARDESARHHGETSGNN